MRGTIEYLPTLDIAGHEPSVAGGADHPMRVMTRRAAGLAEPPWDADARADVAALFDDLASEWHTRTSAERAKVVTDALDRGRVGSGQTALEVGSGIGTYSGLLADSAHLPVGPGTVDAVVLINMLLFPDEVDRVLAPGGCVVWVNSSGESTPIHLLPDEVADALPGSWSGVAGRAGVGLWTVLRRD